ncbi:hypothetical protein BST81_18500 [Leptolyngbya sp. 'hensonii']|uniref:type II toxin-antitoxin system Phd/YefM family antitoxin n=1 Tax=Leptolyngbya sp. 'hensonii' TaxID=1922337 RepID=UPI00094FC4B2|nr:type II toxin-antitoxin system Phd/YefM family antitoxin [Leptolyngbya sp. 'hensonii']OLP16973.1 hypothetical protein BST81_18500 [Leptolyngbya sp. 'hensonii']
MRKVRISEANNHLSELLRQATAEEAPILLTEDDETKGVLLNIKMLNALVSAWQYTNRSLMPLNQLQTSLQQSFEVAGYDSREKIVELVQQIKQEIAEERSQGSIGG